LSRAPPRPRRYWIVSDSSVPWLTEPLLPVIVTTAGPVLALRLAVIFRVELPVAVTGFGLKLALTPLGKVLTLQLTELEPLIAVAVTVVDPLEPRLTVSELGDTEGVKSGGLPDASTVKDAIAVLQLKLKNMLFRE